MKTIDRSRVARYAAEFFVVFLGVWLGFMAEDLREDRRDRADERIALARILSDLDQNEADLRGNLERARAGDSAAVWLLENADRAGVDPDALAEQLRRLQYYSVLGANTSEYAALKGAGRLGLIRDEGVRELLTRTYEFYSVLALGHERENVELRRAMVAVAPYVRRGVPDASQFPTLRLVGDPRDVLQEPIFLTSVAELASLRRFLVGAYERSLDRIEQLRERISTELGA